MNKGPIGMTPTPWAVCDDAPNPAWMEGKTIYCPAEGKRVADTCVLDDRCEANAAYIVLAVNSHADMRTALETIRDIIGRCDADDTEAIREAAWRAHIIARAALNEISAANPEKAG